MSKPVQARNKNRGLRKRRTRLNLLKSGGSRGNKMGSLGFKKILTSAYRLRMDIYLKAKIKRDMGCILVIVLEARHANVLARVNQEPYKFFSRDINSNSSAATLIQILQRGHRTEAIFCFHRSVGKDLPCPVSPPSIWDIQRRHGVNENRVPGDVNNENIENVDPNSHTACAGSNGRKSCHMPNSSSMSNSFLPLNDVPQSTESNDPNTGPVSSGPSGTTTVGCSHDFLTPSQRRLHGVDLSKVSTPTPSFQDRLGTQSPTGITQKGFIGSSQASG
ncbi:uncharacterized protein LOC108192493 isoform X2 [Daucus carota subsp. sativus]|uniref:uncharacterized protein LOC108192493 isoform X2 n=1 Tax=Daucus carota subsp. sativus TaxID=79200 RepID=UPI0030839D3E